MTATWYHEGPFASRTAGIFGAMLHFPATLNIDNAGYIDWTGTG